jgi:transposase-like protein
MSKTRDKPKGERIMRKRKEYTKEFKELSIELYQRSSDKTKKEVAKGLGISPENLRHWINESKKTENTNIRVFYERENARDEELFRLKKENEDLGESNEILKKETDFFVEKNSR